MNSFSVLLEQRLDIFLASQEGISSRAKAQKLIKDGSVTINKKVITKPAYVLSDGDEVKVSSLESAQDESVGIEPVDIKLPILYEDETCIVINKPAGFAVHPAPTTKDEKTILHGVAYLFKERSIPFSSDSVLVHRLDRETTGCMLIAKTSEAHSALQKQFENRTTKKSYLALVAGIPDPPEAMIDAPVGRQLTDRTKMSVFKTSVSRDAKTTYRTLDVANDCALLECDLHTGRTHQVRVHLSSIRHPILADPTYHSSASLRLTKDFKIQNLCLHAWKLSFDSPADGKRQTIEAPLPNTFIAALDSLSITLEKS